MKKIYQAPALIVVKLRTENHLMDLSAGGTASITSDRYTDDDAFAHEDKGWDIWNDE